MRRSGPCLTAALAVTALLVSACDDDDDGSSGSNEGSGASATAPAATAESPEPSPDQPLSPVAKALSSASTQQLSNASPTGEDVYQGTLSISVDYYGYDCQLRDLDLHLEGSRTYDMPVEVVRGPPAEAEGIRESSPFNLVVSANPGNEAGITTVSATVATDPNGAPVLFEYWRTNVNGSSIQAELVNSWRRAGLAANVFPTDRLIVPCRPELGLLPKSIQTINEGAQMEGSITDEQVELTIRGETFDKERRFVARVTATRE
jgi:hypothetical protein